MAPQIFLNRIFIMSEQSWRRWIETVSCPAPQPESHSHDDDPGFHDDPEMLIDFEEGVFYQESLDGSKVALLADHPGTLPSSAVSDQWTSSQKRRSAPVAPSTLTSTPKGRRTTRRISARAAPVAPTVGGHMASKCAVPMGDTSSAPPQEVIYPLYF